MPPRVSRQALGTHVGRVIFQSRATTKLIAKKLESLPGEKLKSALERRGLGDVSVKKLSEVLSGQDRTGMKQHELKQAVEALQEVGVAKKARTASKMVQTAADEIQKGRGLNSLEQHGRNLKKNLNDLGAQRALEEEMMRRAGRGEPVGVLEKMRGVVGSMQRANRDGEGMTKAMEKLASDPEQHMAEQDQGGIRGLRHSIRRVLGIQSAAPVTSNMAPLRASERRPDLPQNPKV